MIVGQFNTLRARLTPLCSLQRGLWLGWLAVLMVACGLVSVSHGTDGMWDTKNYHVYSAFAEFNHRLDSDIAPAQQPGFLNPLLDYPLYIYIRFLNGFPRTVAFLMGLPQGVNLWLIGLISWHISEKRNGPARFAFMLLTIWIGGTGAGTLPLVGTATGDIQVTIPVLGALLMLLRVADAGPNHRIARRRLLACGLLIGLGFGAKPSVACYAVALSVALIVATPWRLLPRAGIQFLTASAVGVLITGGYHAFVLARLFGNPFFPLANTLFHSPFWENAAFRDTRFLPRSIWEALTFPSVWASGTPYGVTAELTFRDIRIALALVAIVLSAITAILSREAPSRKILLLFTFTLVSYAVWAFSFGIYRYALPMEMLSGVLILAALFCMAQDSAVPTLLIAAALACWTTTVPLEWGHTPFRDRYIEVSAPPIDSESLVLIVGSDPVAYLIPFMNSHVRWLGLDNNLLSPEQGNALVARERNVIAAHPGPIFVMDAGASPSRVSAVLAAYGLVEDPNQCDRVSSNLGGEVYALCRVSRDPG